MEKILVSGDSFTNPNYRSHHNTDYVHNFTWTDKLEGEVTNIAVSGQCNPGMIASTLDQIHINKPDRVIIALSCWSRFSVVGYRINPLFLLYKSKSAAKYWTFSELDNQEYKKQLKWLSGIMKSYDYKSPEESIRDFLYENITYLVWKTSLDLNTLAFVCESQGIKLHVFQMLNPFGVPHKHKNLYTDFSTKLIASDLFMNLYDRKVDLIGYPWIKNAGGFNIDDEILSREEGKHRVGNGDAHPNEQGHRLIGDWFNANYKDYEI